MPTRNISPYLVEGADAVLTGRSLPVCEVPKAIYGSKPVDGGHLIINQMERSQILADEPTLAQYLRPLVGAEEYLWNIPRWCFWLVGVTPASLDRSPTLRTRLQAVKEFRGKSKKLPTRQAARFPALFSEIRQPSTRYIVVPLASSETRDYIPIGYFEPHTVITNLCTAIADATLYHFAVLTSKMHMSWVKLVAGRLESRYRYSNTLVYNNYPWPQDPTPAQRAKVEELAQGILDARALYPDSTLAQLYDPLLMPAELVQAHQRLDRAVELCYRPEPFATDRDRVEFLFFLYEQITAPLLPPPTRQPRAPRRPREPTAAHPLN